MVTTEDILIVKVKPEWITEAKRIADEMGCLPKSQNKGGTNVMSVIGELAAADYLGASRVAEVNYDYDLFIGARNLRIDVKSKYAENIPSVDYAMSVWADNVKQKTNYYLFTRVSYDHDYVWLCGWLPKLEFFAQSTFLLQGDVDPDSTLIDPYKASYDRFNVYLRNLNKMSDLLADTTIFDPPTDEYWEKVINQAYQITDSLQMKHPAFAKEKGRRELAQKINLRELIKKS